MVDCTKVRKIEINVVNPDGSTGSVVKYYDIEENKELTANEVRNCNLIPSINIDCANICD